MNEDTGLTTSDQPKRRPPANMIVPTQQRAEWDVIMRKMDRSLSEHPSEFTAKMMMLRKLESMARWNTIRDIIVIVMLAMILLLAGANTQVIQGWVA